MGGIYGELLLAFPEQFRVITVYAMTAQINGGWTRTENSDQIVVGIYQNTKGKQIKDSNGNTVIGKGLELWTKTQNLDGKFLTYNEDVYRLTSSNDWSFEGGYTRYGMDKVIGNDGTEQLNTSWNIGKNNFS